jgi:hypothetical protein
VPESWFGPAPLGLLVAFGLAVRGAGCGADRFLASGDGRWQRPGAQREGRGELAVVDQPCGGLERAEVGEVVFGEVGVDVPK